MLRLLIKPNSSEEARCSLSRNGFAVAIIVIETNFPRNSTPATEIYRFFVALACAVSVTLICF